MINLKLFYNGLNILVTGGTGFIGSHITKKLVQLGANVTVFSRTCNDKNLMSVKDKISFFKGDIQDFDACLKATENKQIVFHLAAFISAPESTIKPLECHNTNICGTFNILEACKQNKVEKLIFSSSAAVYGNTDQICREDSPTNPESPYGYSKLIGEKLCQEYSELYKLKTLSLRYFNVFGDGQNPNGAYAAVVAKFKDCLSRNEQIIIFGDGMQTRDFINVEKVADTNLIAATLDQQLNGQTMNVATGKSINILELFEQLKAEFPDYDKPLTFKPARIGDPKNSFADCNKLLVMLNKAEAL